MQLVEASLRVKIGEKEYPKAFKKYVFETEQDVHTALRDGADWGPDKIVNLINAALDQQARAKARNEVNKERAAEVAEANSIKDFAKSRSEAGNTTSESEARDIYEFLKTVDRAKLMEFMGSK
jgi:hypothetical protein